MKNLFLILITLFFAGCSKEKKVATKKTTFKDSLVIYSEEDWYKIKYGRIKVIDTLCLAEEKRAQKDIAGEKWTYTFLYGLGGYDYSNLEMKALLAQYSIALDTALKSCVGPPKGFSRYCYEKLMNTAIEEKFGKNFIDSLRHIADVKYIENYPEKVFYWHECDTESRYAPATTYDDYLNMPKDDFLKTLNYPGLTKKQMKKEVAGTEVTFILYKNGTVGNIKAKSDFSTKRNKDFCRYFEAQAIDFVKKAKWKPALYRGIPVNSDVFINFYNK